jgi:hypothetical protein
MNVRDYSTLHLNSNEKQVATFVLNSGAPEV